MPVLTPYQLSFLSGMRVGRRGVNLEETGVGIPADTLFAALLATFRRLGGDPQAFAAPFVASPPDPPFLLSSAFPFAGGVRFFPMSADLTRILSPQLLGERGKAAKRIRYLSQALFRLALKGEPLDRWLFPEDALAETKAGIALQGGALWLAVEEVQRLPTAMRRLDRGDRPLHALRHQQVYASTRTPRVTVDRVSSASNIFHAGRTVFAPGCGLWFGVAWRAPEKRLGDSTYRQVFEQLLAVLQDDGLGGERSSGYGAFTLANQGSLSLPDPKPERPAWLLSRYHPRTEELPAALTGAGAAYHLTSVAGWLRSPDGAAMRRRRLHLLAEGSLPVWPGGPAGDVVDVGPRYANPAGDLPHPVYRYGLALAAGFAGEKS